MTPFEALYKNTDVVALLRTYVTTFVACMIAGLYLPLWPHAIVELLGLTGIVAVGVGLTLSFIMGAAASMSGHIVGGLFEGLMTGELPADIYDPTSYLSDIWWGGLFGMAGYGIGEYINSELIKSGSKACRNAMTDQWARNVFEKGIPWGPPKVNGALQAYHLTTDASYWASVDGPQTFAEAIKWAPKNVALLFEWLSGILDIIMNDDAISIYVDYKSEN